MVLTVIPVAEMQHHCGDLTQTFLSPDLPAARVLIVWVLVTPKEPGGGCGEQSGLSAEARSPHSSLAGDLLSHSVVIPGLYFGFPAPLKDTPDSLLRESPCSAL